MQTLYEHFAERFEVDEAVWTRMALEEAEHAEYVQALLNQSLWGDVDVPRDIFMNLEAELNDLHALITAYQKGAPCERREAVELALKLEQGAAEIHGPDLIQAHLDGGMDALVIKLQGEDDKHVKQLQSLLQSLTS